MPLPRGERRGAPRPADPSRTGEVPGAFDQTLAVPSGPGGPGGPLGPYGAGGAGDDRRWVWAGLSIIGVIILGVLIALLLTTGDGDADTPSSTSTSSPSSTSTSSSTTSSSTTTTTVPDAPEISDYKAAPNPATCPNTSTTVQLTLTWTTTNALGVSVSIDGPGKFADYGANGTAKVPFACSGSHSYTLTAKGADDQTTQQTITVQPAVAPPTTTSSTSPPPTTTSSTSPPPTT